MRNLSRSLLQQRPKLVDYFCGAHLKYDLNKMKCQPNANTEWNRDAFVPRWGVCLTACFNLELSCYICIITLQDDTFHMHAALSPLLQHLTDLPSLTMQK